MGNGMRYISSVFGSRSGYGVFIYIYLYIYYFISLLFGLLAYCYRYFLFVSPFQ